MFYQVVQSVVAAGLLYTLVGLIFAVAFVFRGLPRVDPMARGTGLGFRLIILPGAAALWPVLFSVWTRRSSVQQEPRS